MKFLLFLSIFSLIQVQAQVGINTTNPLGTFHVDPLSDTNTGTNITDDIVVSNTGNVGIATVNPAAKLHIVSDKNRGFRLEDGSQGLGKVLISDENENATWNFAGFSQLTLIEGAVCPFTVDAPSGVSESFVVSKADGTPYSITFPALGVYSITFGASLEISSRTSTSSFRYAVLQLVPAPDISLWGAVTPRFIGSYEVYGVQGYSLYYRRFYLSENIVLSDSGSNNTGLIAYVLLKISGDFPTPFRGYLYIGNGGKSEQPQLSGGSYIRLN